ncbi:2-keto-4-pentenoate hydratase/2-oxohepta-3-ene-1,7-dioic acid hydratase (catechol pathway) [Shimia gijangensis]|uniref:2-keto-4-pentenoate hydratase/2-oxohepta-3-ene-1,7-dioic acid hydratase (Catechol pathway) n=1 Tax=Shimia gijangensis TaxID=1470563 RepID=A0A1M6SU01_9RHOB|nr:fumarylacetoacetate hydrolase family protein [Shimia gijangensis]SHK48127.1 2-keto-4-pentenoate hydratase/2-oxohepta-3-ene-1,7-dioic acid hydratase (catechol pathway) [Shimia gijangensis]
MQICSYTLENGTASYGVSTDAGIHDAGDVFRAKYATLRDVLAAGALNELNAAAQANPALDAATVTMLPPITQPDKIICIGLNYMSHIKETGRDKPKYPSIFIRFPDSVLGHEADLIRPKVSEKFDFEGELAVVIGKPARHVAAADALDYVAGYSCFNDGSIRDFQRHTSQFWAGKSFQDSGSMGPCIVTPDEVGKLEDLNMETRLNGAQVQSTSIGDLAFNVGEIIEYLSTVITLLPGDVIATGTPSGVGLFREPQLWMKPGDTIEVEITGLGTLRNTIKDEV